MSNKNAGLAEFISSSLESEEFAKCSLCGEIVDHESADAFGGYWYGTKFLVHKNCKTEASKLQADWCRCVDKNCNDCKHFNGIRFSGTSKSDRKRVGSCLAGKIDGEFSVWPGDPMHMPCFELRERKQ